jgi:hypothetical protein
VFDSGTDHGLGLVRDCLDGGIVHCDSGLDTGHPHWIIWRWMVIRDQPSQAGVKQSSNITHTVQVLDWSAQRHPSAARVNYPGPPHRGNQGFPRWA